jgi:hypothetical protein
MWLYGPWWFESTRAHSKSRAEDTLMYAQRQFGHADIATTECDSGHRERRVHVAKALATVEAIAKAPR